MRIDRTLLAAVAAATLATLGIANAQTTMPATQGLDSVDKNLKRDPDNRGLLNAQQHIETNQKRFAEHKADKAERVEKAERVDRPDRPERPERGGR
jgi:hypothetical protein